MRQLSNHEVNVVSGGGNSYGPTLKQVVSSAIEGAVPSVVGFGVGLALRNAIGWSDNSTTEIVGYAALCGASYVGGYVGTFAYLDPDVLTR